MNDRVTRRDFLDGMACAIVAGTAPRVFALEGAAPYPPARTGYVGSRPEDFEVAHRVRDGRRYDLRSRQIGRASCRERVFRAV